MRFSNIPWIVDFIINFSDAGFLDSNGIDIYGYTENGFEKVFTKSIFDFEPTYLKWIDDRVAEIHALPHKADIRGKVKVFKLRQEKNEGWTME